MTVNKPSARKAKWIGVALTAMVSGLFAIGAAAAPKKLTYATYYGNNEFYETSASYFMKEVTRRSNGQITFEPYYGGSLLKPGEIGAGLSRGVADVALTVPQAFNPREYSLTGVALPFISENPAAFTKAFHEMYETVPEFKGQFERQNQRPLWMLASGENAVFTTKPINSLVDLKGMRIRSLLGVADALRDLGGTPVGVPWVEALELMQRGGVEGVSGTAFAQAAVAGTLDMVKYASNGGRMGNYTVLIYSMNLSTYKKLTDAERKVVDEVAKEVADEFYTRYQGEVMRAVEIFKKSKVQYVHLDDDEVKKWRDGSADKLYQRWASVVESTTKVKPKAFYDDFVARVRKYEKEIPYKTGFDAIYEQSKGAASATPAAATK
jgi:TRAP-type C4-dicarboxylate transport system substrate-binding protein